MLPPLETFSGGLFRLSPNMLPFTRSTRSPLSIAVTHDPTTTPAAVTRPPHHITSNTTISPPTPPSHPHRHHPHASTIAIPTTPLSQSSPPFHNHATSNRLADHPPRVRLGWQSTPQGCDCLWDYHIGCVLVVINTTKVRWVVAANTKGGFGCGNQPGVRWVDVETDKGAFGWGLAATGGCCFGGEPPQVGCVWFRGLSPHGVRLAVTATAVGVFGWFCNTEMGAFGLFEIST
ncbi:hypothetical protein Tco_0494132 [Tanacetum coccineum]